MGKAFLSLILTPRQREVLLLAYLGNKQIARQLGIANSTVRNTFGDLYYRLLGDRHGLVNPRVASVIVALRKGEIELCDFPEF